MNLRHFAFFLGILVLANYASSFCIFSICILEPGQPIFYIGEPATAQESAATVAASKEYICNPDPRVNREYRQGIDTCIPTCNYKDYQCDLTTCTCKSIYTCNYADPQNQCQPGTCPIGKTCKSVLPLTGEPICNCEDETPVNQSASCSSGKWYPGSGAACLDDCSGLNTNGTTFTCNKNCQCEPKVTPIIVTQPNCSLSNITGLCGGWCPDGYMCGRYNQSSLQDPCRCNKQIKTRPFSKPCSEPLGNRSPSWNSSYCKNDCSTALGPEYVCNNDCFCILNNTGNQTNYTCAWSNLTRSCGGTCPTGYQCGNTSSWSFPCTCNPINTTINQTNYTCAFSNITKSCGGTCPSGYACQFDRGACNCFNYPLNYSNQTNCTNWSAWEAGLPLTYGEKNKLNQTRNCTLNLFVRQCLSGANASQTRNETNCTQWLGNQTNKTRLIVNATACDLESKTIIGAFFQNVPDYWEGYFCMRYIDGKSFGGSGTTEKNNSPNFNGSMYWTDWVHLPSYDIPGGAYKSTCGPHSYYLKCFRHNDENNWFKYENTDYYLSNTVSFQCTKCCSENSIEPKSLMCADNCNTTLGSGFTCDTPSCSCKNATINQTNYTCAFSNQTRACGGTCPAGSACNITSLADWGPGFTNNCACNPINTSGNATGSGVTMKVSAQSGIVGGYQSVNVDIYNAGATSLPSGMVSVTINGQQSQFNVMQIPAKQTYTIKVEYSCAAAGSLPISVSSSYASSYAGSLTCAANYNTALNTPLTASSLYSENALSIFTAVFGK